MCWYLVGVQFQWRYDWSDMGLHWRTFCKCQVCVKQDSSTDSVRRYRVTTLSCSHIPSLSLYVSICMWTTTCVTDLLYMVSCIFCQCVCRLAPQEDRATRSALFRRPRLEVETLRGDCKLFAHLSWRRNDWGGRMHTLCPGGVVW